MADHIDTMTDVWIVTFGKAIQDLSIPVLSIHGAPQAGWEPSLWAQRPC